MMWANIDESIYPIHERKKERKEGRREGGWKKLVREWEDDDDDDSWRWMGCWVQGWWVVWNLDSRL